MLKVTYNDPSNGVRVVDCEKVSFRGREETVALLEQVQDKNAIYNLQVFPSWIIKIEYIYGYGTEKAKEVEEVREEEETEESSPIKPIYREGFSTSLRPPLGVKPRFIFLEHRKEEIKQAIDRVMKHEGNWRIQSDWIEEYNEICDYLEKRGGK